MTSERTEGVIFDLDGTLYRLSTMRGHLIFRLLGSLKILRHFNPSRNAVRKESFADGEELAAFFAYDLAGRAGVTPAQARHWYHDEFLGTFIQLLEWRSWSRPGLLPLLSRLRAAGIRLGVASDHGRINEKLQAIGIPPEAFDDILETESVGALKPSPRALSTLAARWGLDPAGVVMVGDRSDRDAAAAIAAGMQHITVNDTTPLSRWGRRSSDLQMTWKAAVDDLLRRTGLE